MAAEGYDLLLIARRAERLDASPANLRGNTTSRSNPCRSTWSIPPGWSALVSAVQAAPDLALLVNNAGFGATGGFYRRDLDPLLAMIQLHAVASVRLACAALPGMVARGHGGVVNVASLAAFIPLPGSATYSATKAFLVTLTQALAGELHGTGVRVQALCPGFVRTEFHGKGEVAADARAAIPDFAFMSARDVVRDSLVALHRGDVVCVPGAGYQIVSVIARTLPTAVLINEAINVAMRRTRVGAGRIAEEVRGGHV